MSATSASGSKRKLSDGGETGVAAQQQRVSTEGASSGSGGGDDGGGDGLKMETNDTNQAKDCAECGGFEPLGNRLAEFLHRIPKTDLHVHLDGSIRLSTLIELAQQHNVPLPAYTEEELRVLVFKDNYEDLDDYLRGFGYITAVMQKPAAIERIAYEFAVDNFSEGVHYVEPRFAPQLLATTCDEMDIICVLKNVNEGMARAKREFNAREEVLTGKTPPFTYSLILCAMRMFLADFSTYYKDFVRVHKYETPKRIYQLASIALVVAHKHFLFKTVHAGEDWGPESIFQAITDLHAERVGHGYNIFNAAKCTKKDPEPFVRGLVDYVAKNRIMLEVCLRSNRQTMPELREDLSQHALKDMLAHGLCVSINTDNRLVSNTTVCKELQLAIETFHISPTELKIIVLEGFKRAFFPGTYLQKRHFVRQCIWHYEKVEREFGLHNYSTSIGGGPKDPATAQAADDSRQHHYHHHECSSSSIGVMEPSAYSPTWTSHTRERHMEEPPEILM